MAVTDLTDATFEESVKGEGITVVDFWAPWCGPCRVVGPVIEELAAEHPDIRFAKVNVDDNQQTAGAFGVRSIPTIGFFKDGEPVGAVVGAYPKEALEDVIRQVREHQPDAAESPDDGG
ncbi:MAG: thioredoxin [Longimicrobiales bacterium]